MTEAHRTEPLTASAQTPASPPKRRGRPPSTDSAQADARRREIVANAAALFDSEGFSSTTMERIAESVGLRKSSLYHYFRSRDDVLFAIHDEFIDLLNEAHEKRVAEGGWSRDRLLEEVMVDICTLMQTHRGHVRVFFEHHRELEPHAREQIRAKRDRYFRSVDKLIAEGAAAGEYHVQPNLASLALFGMCNWAYQWYDPAGPYTPRQVAHEFWTIFRTGVQGAEARVHDRVRHE